MQGITLNDNKYRIQNGIPAVGCGDRTKTLASKIMSAHSTNKNDGQLHIKFDALVSHDITYVAIIQTAVASGMKEFPIPYALTNCHNSLCAVGGTINEDDHVFGLSAAKKYGGIYVPANLSVIHSYAREALTGCGKMILGSDSHTRYGALGTMGIGEGGPELVKQLVGRTYDIKIPETVLVWLTGTPKKGIGPHDVALALVGATFGNGFVRNKVLEFAGPGIANLSTDFRNGVDVMTTETACLTSIWETDSETEKFLTKHGRPEQYKKLSVEEGAEYDSMIEINLSEIESMIALPFHPSNVYTIHELNSRAAEIFDEIEKTSAETFGGKKIQLKSKILPDGRVQADQGIIAGCSGGMFESIAEAAAILDGKTPGNNYFSVSVYPTSVPVSLELTKQGITGELMSDGVIIKPSFCGPCFGAGDVPSNNALSLRHTTRNFPNREGSKPGEGQLAGVALMDARSIAATAANGGIITAATDIDYEFEAPEYNFDGSVYEKRVYNGFGKANPNEELIMGPNITGWPAIPELEDNILLELAAVIRDPVTTTDELIPSGETSSYRSNPLRLAKFALSRRVPEYVPNCANIKAKAGNVSDDVCKAFGCDKNVQIASCVFANRPGDGSAREQAASSQRVLGGGANICYEYATKRYRSNCINWGILPFTLPADADFDLETGDMIYISGIKSAIADGKTQVIAKTLKNGKVSDIILNLNGLSDEDRQILIDGCLMNYYRNQVK